MARSTGVEIAHNRIRLLELDGAPGREITILKAHEATVRPQSGETLEQAQTRTLREAFVKSRISADRVYVSIDAGDSMIREVTLPFTDDDQIRKTVRFELENLVHNFTLEQLVVDFFVAEKREKDSAVIVTAIPKDLMRARLGVCEQAGIDPAGVDLDIWALCNALHQAGQITAEKTFILLHGGIKYTKMVFFDKGRPRHIRSLRFGVPEFTGERPGEGAAAPAEKATGGEAEGAGETEDGEPLVMVMNEAAEGEPAVVTDRGTFLQLLHREISRFLLSSAAAGSPAHIVATGEVLRSPDVLAVLEEKTGLPVSAADCLGPYEYGMSIDEEVHFQATYAVPLGLALKGIDQDYLSLDFRQDEFVYFKKFDVIKQSVAFLVSLAAIALAIVGTSFLKVSREYRSDTAQAQAWTQDVFKDTFPGTPIPEAGQVLRAFQSRIEEAGELNPQDHPLPTSALRLWKSLFDRLNAYAQENARPKPGGEKVFVMIDRMEIKQIFLNRITLDLRTGSVNQADGLKSTFRQEPLFQQIKDAGPVKPNDKGQIVLQVQIDLEKATK